MHASNKLNEITIKKEAAREFLKRRKWAAQSTSDNKEYWSFSGGQLMTLEDAFTEALEMEIPKARTSPSKIQSAVQEKGE